MASGKSTLFLGDLSAFCSEEDVHAIFSPFGEVIEIKIMRSEETLRNLSYGFIKFANPADAKKAMNALDGTLFCGRHLRVGWASFRSKKEPKPPQHHDRIESASVHISYISYQLRTLITEESLRILFSTYGVVLDCSIKKSYVDQAINRQCGYGFIHYASTPEGVESALAAVAGLNDSTLNDVCYKCSISHNLEKQLMSNNTSKTPSGATTPIPGPAPNTPTPNQQQSPLFSQSHSILKSTFTTTTAATTSGTSAGIAASGSGTNNITANANAFPRPTSHSVPLKARGGISLSHPSTTNTQDNYNNSAAASPMSWSPAPGFYSSHHQLYQSQQQQPSRTATNTKIEDKRHTVFQQRQMNLNNDDESYFSSLMEREFSGRLPLHVNTSDVSLFAGSNFTIGTTSNGINNNVTLAHHQSNYPSNASSVIGSQRTSPTNSNSSSVTTNTSITHPPSLYPQQQQQPPPPQQQQQQQQDLLASSRLPASTFFVEHNPFLSQPTINHHQRSRHHALPQGHHLHQQQQHPSVFHFDKNESSSFSLTSSNMASFLNSKDNTNNAFVAASAILGANASPTDVSNNINIDDLNMNALPADYYSSVSCSVSTSSGRYSLFSDSASVGHNTITMAQTQKAMSSYQPSQTSPIVSSSSGINNMNIHKQLSQDDMFPGANGTLPGFFYDSLLNLSVSTDRTDMDNDSFCKQHSTNTNLPKQFAFSELETGHSLSNHVENGLENMRHDGEEEREVHAWMPTLGFFDTATLKHGNNTNNGSHAEVTSPHFSAFSSF